MKNRLNLDNQYYNSGIKYLCGIDEAGRGPLAGPVVAAAVMLPPYIHIPKLNDSKKLNEKTRDELNEIIQKTALSFAIGAASVEEIDKLNIRQATFLAMKRAVDALTIEPEFLIVDGSDFPVFTNKESNGTTRGESIVKGDTKSLAIAGASVLAKVYRDHFMKALALEYPNYGFERHKGYGTELHRKQIIKYGATKHHRKLFIRKLGNDDANRKIIF
jgi:ribonuclease HII